MSEIIAGIRVPDSAIVRAATQLVRDTEDDLLYNHSRRVFLLGRAHRRAPRPEVRPGAALPGRDVPRHGSH